MLSENEIFQLCSQTPFLIKDSECKRKLYKFEGLKDKGDKWNEPKSLYVTG